MNNNTNRSLLSSNIEKNPIFPDILKKIPDKTSNNDKNPIECQLKDTCKGCGGKSGIIAPVDRSTGNPHSYRLECGDCGRFQRWIGQKEFDHKIGKGGRDNA